MKRHVSLLAAFLLPLIHTCSASAWNVTFCATHDDFSDDCTVANSQNCTQFNGDGCDCYKTNGTAGAFYTEDLGDSTEFFVYSDDNCKDINMAYDQGTVKQFCFAQHYSTKSFSFLCK
ncbi:Uu.00g143420.m01.CDS01 [Anthostomella pinea]|uniref:Uu.00g143420.m01.CDS01 n=1 Tax=Anthostomella pinea TaxID=933095 RepID=A0AAI8YJ97_9PEZI|nr:Uu.00g143420.m01.CDS01 [Anthostomella pinea]